MPMTKEYDLTGLKCPLPIVRLNKIIKDLSIGETCTVMADDVAFCADLEAWCHKTGHQLVTCDTKEKMTVAVIRKNALQNTRVP